ncbi:2-(1,2-epoxy-1,2-dihydrophenyl)acetyl-CoA isomerase PaaG [soil metagenome]
MTGPLHVERHGALAVLTLDRPHVLNAFDEPLTSAFAAALGEASSDGAVRAVAITGAGRAFSACQDLADRALAIERGGLHLGDELRRRYHPIVTAIQGMPKPVLAAINGVVAGAAFGIACACDLRVAAASATFRAAWSKVGLAPDAGAAFFLPRLVGSGRAAEIALTGRVLTAQDAPSIGLVNRVWPDADFDRELRALARELAAGPTAAVALAKEGLRAAWEHGLASFLDVEAGLQERAGRTADYAEGVRAFAAKRPAQVTGR